MLASKRIDEWDEGIQLSTEKLEAIPKEWDIETWQNDRGLKCCCS